MKKTKRADNKPAPKTGADQAHRNHTASKPRGKKRTVMHPGIATVLIVAVLAFAVLMLFYGNYMRKTESLSIFLPTASFFGQCMATPGGVLTWVSTYLTQFMLFPWAGALIYAAILSLVTWLSIKAFGVPRDIQPAMALPAALILLAYTNLGYMIFSLKPAGYAFALPLGILSVVWIFWGFRAVISRAKNTALSLALGIAYIVAVTVAGYPLLGFYALLAAAMCALGSIGRLRLSSVACMAVAAALIFLWPRWWFYHIDGDLILSETYVSALPRFYTHEVGWKIFYTGIFALMVIGAVLSGTVFTKARLSESKAKWPARLSTAVCLLSVAAVFALRNSDRNLQTTLALDRALWQQDWTGAVNIAQGIDFEPTRVNTVLSYIAMMRTGEAADRMFGIVDSKAPYNTTRAASAFNDIAAPLVAYHLGLLNYSYRWATESSIGQGMSVERMKLMAKIALLNGEPDLAGTYLDILYNIPTHREWAARYMRYKQHPIEISGDPEFAAIIPLMCNPNEFINDGGGAFESYVWPLLARGQKGSPQYVNLSLQAALINRDLDRFVERLTDYRPASPRIPRYYQEAALLWSVMTKQPAPIPIEQTVVDSHNRFLEAFRSTSNREAEDQRDNMRGPFGSTYFFYYVFNDDMLLK